MAPITISVGALLCVLGAVFYGGLATAGHSSPTALIPTFLGFPIAVLGFLSRKESLRKHTTHAALGLALLGLLGSLRGFKNWGLLFSGTLTESQTKAAWEMLLLFLICAVYLLIGVNSFIKARQAKSS